MNPPYFIGIDVGTQGARAVLVDSAGNMMASANEEFNFTNQSLEEQAPGEWWVSCARCIKNIIAQLRDEQIIQKIKAMSVTSTSGTVIPLDAKNQPLHKAIMYSDKRSEKEGKLCRELVLKYNPSSFTGFNSSCGISKMIWYINEFPAKVKDINRWIHASDFIIGTLSGNWGVTDYTNALKSAYDVKDIKWPTYLFTHLPLRRSWMPEVVPSGTVIGTLQHSTATELGLSENTQVVAGITDGCASQIASGAVNLGDWNTTIGTTLVVKGVTGHQIKDPEDRIYNHRHPDGFWMPGGASNIGADWISRGFKNDLDALNEEAKCLMPSGKFSYPLLQKGERFPFIAPAAEGFSPSGNLSRAELYTANLEGVAYIERYAYEMIEDISGEKIKRVFTAGGGSNSDVWLTIRCNILNLPVFKMKYITGAVGAAILAASKTHFTSIAEAAKAMTKIEKEVHPANMVIQYDVYYRQFINLMKMKGFIGSENYV